MRISDIDANRRRLLRAAAGLSATAVGSVQARTSSNAYPSRTIRVVVPFTPGGGTDVVGRALLEGMQRELGQALIMDNKPGAGTVIGSDLVAKAPGDGYTLLLTTSAIAINDSLVKKLPYATNRDIQGVGLVCSGPNVLVTHPNSKYRTVADVIAAAKAAPGRLTYASSGNGSAVHLAGELFKLMAKVNIVHVPYKGAGPAYTDLIGGQVDLLFGTAGGAQKLVNSGRMRAIAVTSKARTSAYPDVPTIAETIPGYEADVWYAMFAPATAPAIIVERVNAALRKAAEEPAYKQRLADDGLTVAVNTPAAMTSMLHAEQQRWRKVVIDGRVTLD